MPLAKLAALADGGVPEKAGMRALVWKVTDLWREPELAMQHA